MSMAEKLIRNCASKGMLKYSNHSVVRMGERKIWRHQVEDAIINGKVIEQQNIQNEDVKVLFQEATAETPQFYVVVAACLPEPEVVTVAYFEDEVWEFVGRIPQRRR